MADGAKSLTGVLVRAQCSALTHLDLCDNKIGPNGAKSLSGVLDRPQCSALTHLNLYGNKIGHDGAKSLSGVLSLCHNLKLIF